MLYTATMHGYNRDKCTKPTNEKHNISNYPYHMIRMRTVSLDVSNLFFQVLFQFCAGGLMLVFLCGCDIQSSL